MSEPGSALMSVVIVTDTYSSIRKTMRHLRAQTVNDRLEVVIVAPSRDALGLDESERDGFQRVQVIEVGPLESLSWARAAGIRQASAPLVALAENHCYPDPHWAEALVEAHQQPWAAVGPAIGNANPDTLVSWSNLYIDYGPWVEPVPAGEIDDLPGHNSSYKRALLLEYGDRLETMLEAETTLHWDLRARGYRLYLEPEARTLHLNVSLPSSWLAERFWTGRRFAAARAQNQHWSPLKRAAYAGGAPLIPLVRLARLWPQVRRRPALFPRILPALMVGLAVSAAGEMVGYALGSGISMEKTVAVEMDKGAHLVSAERQAEWVEQRGIVPGG
ncbi:MAG TPA: glycosyltransferase [Ardenticatenaceae bacterium]|nr:glycosyltransferase [Ardenticatenaceae bacterium]